MDYEIHKIIQKYKHLKGKTGVYRLVNKINGKFYLGSTSCELGFFRRFREHLKDLKTQRHSSRILQNAFNKYGIENFYFEVVEECPKEITLEREEFYLKKMKPKYNTHLNALAPGLGKFGHLHAFSVEVCCVNTGEIFGSAKMAADFFGVAGTSVLRCCKKQSRQLRGLCFAFSDDHEHIKQCEEYLESDLFRVNPRAKSFIHINTGKIHHSSGQAAKELNIPLESLRGCLKEEKLSAKGQLFCYLENPKRIEHLKKVLKYDPTLGTKASPCYLIRNDGKLYTSTNQASQDVGCAAEGLSNVIQGHRPSVMGFSFRRIDFDTYVSIMEGGEISQEIKDWMIMSEIHIRCGRYKPLLVDNKTHFFTSKDAAKHLKISEEMVRDIAGGVKKRPLDIKYITKEELFQRIRYAYPGLLRSC